jgi:4-aminobutyrate aminotransferase/4-aminobutyrate aminotransferase/(S)-3-amino-2-methylpropionate transaminase
MFFEPVQGEGGYNVASRDFLEYLRALCDEHGIVLVADEIQTGMGRTGKMFAMEHYGIHPDLTCIGKSIGGGLPISGILGKADVIDSVPLGGLGGTFGGNPMSCAAALAVLDTIEQENLLQRGLEMGLQIDARLRKMGQRNSFNCIGDVRALGCMNAFEIVKDRDSREPDSEFTAKIVSMALNNGLILLTAGPARNVIRLLVPLTAAPETVDEGLDILQASLEEALIS